MATQYATSVPSKRLAAAILSTDSSFTLNNIRSWAGLQDGSTNLTSADFGTRAFGCFRNASNTQIEFFEFDPTTIASSTITIISRGLSYLGGTTDGVATKYNWPANSTIVELGGTVPQLFEQYVDKISSESIDGVKTFTSSPVVPTPTGSTDAANKAYVDNGVLQGAADSSTTVKGIGRLAASPNVTKGTCTITIASPAVITFNSHGLTVNDTVQFTTSGSLPTGITASTTYYVISAGLATNTFEISATLGGAAINTSGSQSGTHTLIKTTPIFVGDNDTRVPSSSQAAALPGTGTPSSTDPYVNLSTLSGIVVPYGGQTAPTGWLLCDGTAVSRTTYATLFGLLNPTLGTVTITIATPGVVTLNSHGLATGDAIYLTTTGALPTGLSVNTRYWVIKNDANSFWLATSLANALAGTKINTSGTQSGTHTSKLTPHGVGDGSTTFNLPNLKGVVVVGKNQSDTEFAGLGQTGGEKTHVLTTAEMPSHTHTLSGGTTGLQAGAGAPNGGGAFSTAAITVANAGSDGAHNNLQPYVALNYIIKY